jgi:catechol 2,3-dioxygenase-like lactoylglutathione lyase family enzyme
MIFTTPTPILRIFDESRAREFYLGFLGFRVDWEHRFDANAPIYMQISLDQCRLHLSEHHGDGCPGAQLRIETPDVDAYQAALVAKQYKYYRPGLTDTDWFTRDMQVQDPFGNRLIFFRPLPRP